MPSQKQKVLQCAALFAAHIFEKKILDHENLMKIAQTLTSLFPRVFPDERVLVICQNNKEACGGLLYEAVLRHVFIEPRNTLKEQSAHLKDLPEIQEFLHDTLHLRRSLLRVSNFHDQLDYILVKPLVLINFEFELTRPGMSNCLLDMWPKISEIMQYLEPPSPDIAECSSDIQDVLCFLKFRVYPQPPDYTKLLEFQEDSAANAFRGRPKPYIGVRYSGIKSNVVRYALVIHTKVLKVPKDFQFIQVLDLLYKVHHIFCIEYHESLKEFFKYFDEHIYTKQNAVQSESKFVDNKDLNPPLLEIKIENEEAE